MKSLVFVSAASAALLIAGAASAQVAGGLTGQVGGSVGVQTPSVGQTVRGVGQVTRETVRDTRDVARDTVRDARDAARDARPDVEVNANANARADVRANRDGAATDTAIQTGVMVHSSDGVMLGTVADVVRNAQGRATSFVLRTADGATRTVPAGNVSLEGEALVTTWTDAQFKAQ